MENKDAKMEFKFYYAKETTCNHLGDGIVTAHGFRDTIRAGRAWKVRDEWTYEIITVIF